MARSGEDWRPDFEQALGETFGGYLNPPMPLNDASPHECCEVVWYVVGRDVTPTRLAGLRETEIAMLAARFGEYFGSAPPSVEQIKKAVTQTLARWPVSSLRETA